jgi:hypothetical protein
MKPTTTPLTAALSHAHPQYPYCARALEIRDVYKPSRPSDSARLGLASTSHAHGLIDTSTNTLLAFPIKDRHALFAITGQKRLQNPDSPLPGLIEPEFYRWKLNCRMAETSRLQDLFISPPKHMVLAISYSLSHHINTQDGRTPYTALL